MRKRVRLAEVVGDMRTHKKNAERDFIRFDGAWKTASTDYRLRYFDACARSLVCEHFGCSVNHTLSAVTICRRANQFFCDSSWYTDDDDASERNKDSNRKDLTWFKPLRLILFTCLNLTAVGKLQPMLAWFDEKMIPEYTDGEVEDELGFYYLILVSQIRSTSFGTELSLRKKIRKASNQRSSLLLDSLDAIRDRNVQAFVVNIEKSVQNFRNTREVESYLMSSIAVNESILWSYAIERKLNLPSKISDEMDSVIVRRI
jgi:hypothetical protein